MTPYELTEAVLELQERVAELERVMELHTGFLVQITRMIGRLADALRVRHVR